MGAGRGIMMIQTAMPGSKKKLHRGSSPSSQAAAGSKGPSVRTSSVVFGSGSCRKAAGDSAGKASSNGARPGRWWSPGRLIVYSLLFGLAGSLYLTHVFQTQGILSEVQQLRREHERAQRIFNDTRRTYDASTGPAEVYRRAESLGLVSGGATDPILHID